MRLFKKVIMRNLHYNGTVGIARMSVHYEKCGQEGAHWIIKISVKKSSSGLI